MRIVKLPFFGKNTAYHQIWDYYTEIGEIKYKVHGNMVVISFLGFDEEYQRKGYGTKVVEKLIKQYPTKIIVGESLRKSAGFWNKCIKKYSGKKYKLTYSNNCVFAFALSLNGKKAPSNDSIVDVLEKEG